MSRTYGFVPILALVALFALLSLAAAGRGPLPGDTALVDLAQALSFLPFARFFEGPVDALILPFVALAGIAVAVQRGHLDLAFVFAITWPSSVLNTLAKLATERARPAGDFAILSSTDTWSFPSGHAYLAAVIAGAWVLYAIRCPGVPLRRPIIAAAITVIVVAGFSRIWLGVHWPSDVLGAWLLAALVLAAAAKLGGLVEMSLRRSRQDQQPGPPVESR